MENRLDWPQPMQILKYQLIYACNFYSNAFVQVINSHNFCIITSWFLCTNSVATINNIENRKDIMKNFMPQFIKTINSNAPESHGITRDDWTLIKASNGTKSIQIKPLPGERERERLRQIFVIFICKSDYPMLLFFYDLLFITLLWMCIVVPAAVAAAAIIVFISMFYCC